MSAAVGRGTRRGLRRLLAVLVVLLLAAGVVAARYPKPTRAYLTHWKGSPTETVAYVAPGATVLRLAVAGDIGDSGRRLDATAAAMARVGGDTGFDALLLLGDNSYPRGAPEELPNTVFRPFAPVLDGGAELLAILGNHDVRDGNGDDQIAALRMPGRWWAREWPDVLVVGLDSTEPRSAVQRDWLVDTLRASDAKWKIVMLHHPPYSAGYQGSSLDARTVFSPLFERYGVDLVLSGHDHDYQRSKPQNGVVYVVTGAAAGTRRTSSRSFTETSFSWHHFVEIDIYADRLVGRAVNQDARVADTWVLRGDPQPA